MKPGDHPDFFRLAPPPGTSRESTIVLDRHGVFFHDGVAIERSALARALASWVALHPDDGRTILTNGYDWCYFRAEDTPLFVEAVLGAEEGSAVLLRLSDGSEEPLDPALLSEGEDGVVYARVRGGALEARFLRHAQTQLAPLLVGVEPSRVRVGEREAILPLRPRR
jgi:hypothetical protein